MCRFHLLCIIVSFTFTFFLVSTSLLLYYPASTSCANRFLFSHSFPPAIRGESFPPPLPLAPVVHTGLLCCRLTRSCWSISSSEGPTPITSPWCTSSATLQTSATKFVFAAGWTPYPTSASESQQEPHLTISALTTSQLLMAHNCMNVERPPRIVFGENVSFCFPYRPGI